MSALHLKRKRMQGLGHFLLLIPAIILSLFTCMPPSAAQRTRSQSPTFTARLINLEATSKETFRFNATLHNTASQPVIYSLFANVPQGWNQAFRLDGMQVTSFRADSGRLQDISIEITPAPETKPGVYKIPVTATSGSDTLLLTLEAVVRGAYALELTTPNGLLSGEITEGSREPIHLILKNTGTLPLDGLELSAQSPTNWDATFQPSKVERLEPGKTLDVVANLKVPDKTIAGDYVTTFTAHNSSVNANAVFRMTVTTSWLAGWVGVLIILAAVGIIYLLIRKYGRR